MPAAVAHSLINCQHDKAALTARAGAAARSLGRVLRLWRARIKARQAFPILNERDLRDLRLSRWDVERELAKPFWRD